MQGFGHFVWIYFYKSDFPWKYTKKILNHILILYFACNFLFCFVLIFAKNLEISKIEKFHSREKTVTWEREVRISSLWNFGAPLKTSPSQWPAPPSLKQWEGTRPPVLMNLWKTLLMSYSFRKAAGSLPVNL